MSTDDNPTHDPSSASSVQPEAEQDLETVIESKIEETVIDRIESDNQSIEADVRNLLNTAENALAGDSRHDAGDVLETIHYYLVHDDRVDQLLSPYDDTLDRDTKIQFQDHKRMRANGQAPPPRQEYVTQSEVAIGLNYIYSVSDKTRYLPVRMEKLDSEGVTSPVDGDPTPIGRRRVGKDETINEYKSDIKINHDDCEHGLVIALPRKGKDSTITSICGNLKDEHGYKWFSCLDDGRNETPMTAIPNDEDAILENLDKFGQDPTAYNTRVYVPNTDGAPDVLPSNFERFTISLEDLTPQLILRVAGINTSNSTTIRRIGQARKETLEANKGVGYFTDLLKEYAGEIEATITVREYEDDSFTETDDGHRVVEDADAVEEAAENNETVREVNYEMGADKALEEAAESLIMLSGEGLIGDPGDDTNLDIEREFLAQDRVAVLNCNFLEPRNESLKFIILNLWLQLIFRQRDENARVPRALLEIRELKDIAPSVIANAEFKDEVKALRSTLYDIATRGGSRRVMMLGSTQKMNDIYKPIRTNMPIKILLQLGEEEILTLDRAYNFSNEQKRQLTDFDPGQGMLMKDGQEYWPITWRGARCGLGAGDIPWRDRYAKAWGARAYNSFQHRGEPPYDDLDTFINTRTGSLKEYTFNEEPAVRGLEPQDGEWHLLWRDIIANVPVTLPPDPPEDLTKLPKRVVGAALEARRDTEVACDLSLTRNRSATTRELAFQNADEAMEEQKRRLLNEKNVPKPLETLIGEDKKEMRDRMLAAIREIDYAEPGELQSLADLADVTGTAKGTFGTWRSSRDDFSSMMEKRNGEWKVTRVGQRALEINWEQLDDLI